jgi:hypothetical protein
MGGGKCALKIVDECDDVIGQHARELLQAMGVTVVDLRSEEFKYALRQPSTSASRRSENFLPAPNCSQFWGLINASTEARKLRDVV